MKTIFTTAALTIGLALPAFAAGDIVGDADAGAKVFNRCKACHSITDDSGKKIVRGGRIGPNLYGVVGRPMGAQDGFKYSKGMQDAAGKGDQGDEEDIREGERPLAEMRCGAAPCGPRFAFARPPFPHDPVLQNGAGWRNTMPRPPSGWRRRSSSACSIMRG